MAGGKASAAKLKLLERRHMAVTLRKQGGTYRQIAEQLRKMPDISPKYNESQAVKDVAEELERLVIECQEDAAALRALELARIEELWAAFYGRAKAGDYMALDKLIVLQNQRAKYLPGLLLPPEMVLHQDVTVTHEDDLSDKERVRLLLFMLAQAEGNGKETDQETNIPETQAAHD